MRAHVLTVPGLKNGGEMLSLQFMTFIEPPYARDFLVKCVSVRSRDFDKDST